MNENRIVIHHLYSNGDCLFATAVAREIKYQYPDSHLSWIIASQCKGMIFNNPNVDDIIEIDLKKSGNPIKVWRNNEIYFNDELHTGKIKALFSTQILDKNEGNYTGTIRSSVLKSAGLKFHTGIKPEIFLTSSELKRVNNFISQNNIIQYKNIIIFECQPLSGQVPVTPVMAEKLANEILNSLTETCFILTSGTKINSENPHIYDASTLTIRENVELLKFGTHLIGCSSGISWMSLCNDIPVYPILQIMDNMSFYYNSMIRDLHYFDLSSNHVIEIPFNSEQELSENIMKFILDFNLLKTQYPDALPDKSRTIYSLLRRHSMKGNFICFINIIRSTIKLNKKNTRYYLIIIKSILLFPLHWIQGSINKKSIPDSTH